MTIFFNNIPENLPDTISTIGELAQLKNIPTAGTAIAVNDKLIKKDLWNVTRLNELDRIVVITAAYGG